MFVLGLTVRSYSLLKSEKLANSNK